MCIMAHSSTCIVAIILIVIASHTTTPTGSGATIFNKRNDIITICLRFALKMNKSAIKLLPFIKTNVTMKECLKKYFKISSVYYFITSNEWYVLAKRKRGGIGAHLIIVMTFFKDTNEKNRNKFGYLSRLVYFFIFLLISFPYDFLSNELYWK